MNGISLWTAIVAVWLGAMKTPLSRTILIGISMSALAACSQPFENETSSSSSQSPYGAVIDGEITIPAVSSEYLEGPNQRTEVQYGGFEAPGTIVVDPYAKFLYFINGPGQATRYPVAVGREGRGFRGRATIKRKENWPGWAPTKNMLRSEPEIYGPFAKGIPGGVASPLGARALYLFRGGRDTWFRIHGTNDLRSIGNANTAGCIRLFNQDVIHLSERTPLGTEVVVRTYQDSIAAEGPEMANRGVELPPTFVDPDKIYAAVEAEKLRKAQRE